MQTLVRVGMVETGHLGLLGGMELMFEEVERLRLLRDFDVVRKLGPLSMVWSRELERLHVLTPLLIEDGRIADRWDHLVRRQHVVEVHAGLRQAGVMHVVRERERRTLEGEVAVHAEAVLSNRSDLELLTNPTLLLRLGPPVLEPILQVCQH